MKRKTIWLVLCILLITLFSGCSRKNDTGKVYYLNFKPEQDAAWQQLAQKYTEETGVEVEVLTAAEGQYEQTLTGEMDKSDAPTLFQVNGPVGLANWKDYCLDLSGSKVLGELTDDSFALREDDKVYGIAYAVETYGIIYNKTLLDKYFDSDFSTVKRVEDINNFDSFSSVVREIQSHKEELGVQGAFTSAGMDASSDWRFKNHLANLPIYYEYTERDITSADKIEGRFLDGYKNIWDLYINNSTVEPTALSSKTATDAATEFKTGKAVFYQNGTWEYGNIKEQNGVGLKDEELGILPIYIGAPGEEEQGLCTGSENYWCVNARASQADQQATLDFLYWVVSDEDGTEALAEDMGFVAPFKMALEAENPLVKIAAEYVSDGKTPVSWAFTTIPSDNWKNALGTALTQYAAGKGSWDDVERAFVEGWESEYAAAHK
ncbi:MAG: ABC transporter substrate-binding protein [Clostridia bacterium]|nr:ABC transporter substrate-binding protein [Clostridia bacterium]